MTTKTINEGDFYLLENIGASIGSTSISYGGKLVEIHSASIEPLITNNMITLPLPNLDGTTPMAQVVDIKRILETIQVSGFLEDESSEAAITKRNNLWYMIKYSDELIAVWGIGNYQTAFIPNNPTDKDRGIFIQQISIPESTGKIGDLDVSTDPAPEKKYEVKMSLVRGKSQKSA